MIDHFWPFQDLLEVLSFAQSAETWNARMAARRMQEAMARDSARSSPRAEVPVKLRVRSSQGQKKLDVNQSTSGRGLKAAIKQLFGLDEFEDIHVRRDKDGKPGNKWFKNPSCFNIKIFLWISSLTLKVP